MATAGKLVFEYFYVAFALEERKFELWRKSCIWARGKVIYLCKSIKIVPIVHPKKALLTRFVDNS